MLFVVIQHVVNYSIFPEIEQADGHWTIGSYVAQCSKGFLCVAVDCFVLISGYFGIKFKLRHIANLYFTCAFYNLFAYVIHILLDDAVIGKSLILNVVFPFSHSTLWFINCYVMLFFYAPLLNAAVAYLNKKQHLIVILSLVFTNVYLGNFWQAPLYDLNGLSILNFMLLYLIGRYVNLYISQDTINVHRWLWLIIYVGCALFAGIGSDFDHIYHWIFWRGFTYNSLQMIFGALALFLFAKSFRFHSRTINWIAVSTLAIYLGHEHAYVNHHLYRFIAELAEKFFVEPYSLAVDAVYRLLYVIVISVIIAAILVLFDKIRILLMKPIWKVYETLVPKIIRLSGKGEEGLNPTPADRFC